MKDPGPPDLSWEGKWRNSKSSFSGSLQGEAERFFPGPEPGLGRPGGEQEAWLSSSSTGSRLLKEGIVWTHKQAWFLWGAGD